MTFWQGFKFAHRESLAFIFACPLLALIPFGSEFLQHVVEMQIGMYDGVEGAKAAEANPLRMQFGFVKVLALSIIAYPVIRFLAGDRDKAAAHRLDGRALRLFAIVLAFQLSLAALDLFALRELPMMSLGLFVASLVLMPLLLRWAVAAPLGIWLSPVRSLHEMLPAWLWAVVFGIAVILPLMVAHYALNAGTIFAPDWAKWPLLIFDTLVVTWLAVVMIAGQWVAATRPGPIAAPAQA
jgi:hypothetical protein